MRPAACLHGRPTRVGSFRLRPLTCGLLKFPSVVYVLPGFTFIPLVPRYMSQSWALSEDANKASGICSVCRATRQIHIKDGTVHRHGPRKNPCPGSHKPPVSIVKGNNGASSQTAVTTQVSDSLSPEPPDIHPAAWQPPECSTMKHIPKSARPTCAAHLASLLRNVIDHPDDKEPWLAVFNWATSILHPPKRGGRRHNVTNAIKKRLDQFTGNPLSDNLPEMGPRRRSGDVTTALARAVSAKLEEGNMRAAIQLLSSDDTLAPQTDETLRSLKAKHPPPTPLPPDLENTSLNSLVVDKKDILKAISSFPPGSAAGPDGLRPQHLKDLAQCGEAGSGFIDALTDFVNFVLDGHCHAHVKPLFFGGRLLALSKKCGGIRPIAVGMTLRRLASKCASHFGIAHLTSYLSPRQLGVGIPGGCEAAVHAVRRMLQSLPDDHVVAKLDFSNAFNTLQRAHMLRGVKDRLPSLYSYCHSAYSQPSFLFYGSNVIMSSEGTQQGDPLGPLLFSNTLQPLLLSLQSHLNVSFLDDLTLGGPTKVVAADIQTIITQGAAMGLQLNCAKCELVAHADNLVTDATLLSFCSVSVSDAVLLGAPLFKGPILDVTWRGRCLELDRMIDRLGLISSQDALLLLRASFGVPRVQHMMRCSPSVDHPALDEFDKSLRTAVSRITNADLTDLQWKQASLPIRMGGLGVRRVASLALPAFLASAASTLPIQSSILASTNAMEDNYISSFVAKWQAVTGRVIESSALPVKQALWDQPCVQLDKEEVENALTDMEQKARLLAVSAPHSGDWLVALPLTSCGLRLDDEAVRVAVSLRLGVSLGAPHTCRCGAAVDARGLHSFVCKKAPGRIARHQQLNDMVTRTLISAGVPATKEPIGLLRTDGKRPDGMTLIPWQDGKLLVWDVTVTTTLADSYVASAARRAGEVAEQAAIRKQAKYSALSNAYSFLPLAFETLGPMNEEAFLFFGCLGRRLSGISGDNRESSFLFQRLSIAIQRFNSVLFRDSFLSSVEPDQ